MIHLAVPIAVQNLEQARRQIKDEFCLPSEFNNKMDRRDFLKVLGIGGADLNQLGDVDGVDLGLFVEQWLNYCPYNWPLR